jgi:hypothetical protein
MCWTSFIVGICLGGSIGIVVTALLVAAKRRDVEDHSTQPPMDYAVMNEIEEVQGELSHLPEPETYFDRYPHS